MKLSTEQLKELRGLCNDSTAWASVLDELISIRELKGNQVPVAWQVTTPSGSIVFHTEEQDMDGHSYYGNAVTPLFTAPQKPIVLPKSHYVCGCADWFMSAPEVIAAIKAAGGIVKDGE